MLLLLDSHQIKNELYLIHTHKTKQNQQTSKYKLASDVLFKY
jgi:hypothetical protein